ncbi:SNF2 family N-terminal domain-containing protein [Crassisporium funariophilum]|nr:SNF2 family N-terminal domain-containing protein [Crassisporium funariophilum]
MLSSTESNAENKRNALEALRFRKNQHANRHQAFPLPSSTLQESSSQPPYAVPPSQSRDATVPSRFFPTTPSGGNVLVPNSSPLSLAGSISGPYQPYNVQRGHDVASTSSLTNSHVWAQPRTNLTFDPLSAPSGFVSHAGPSHASLRRQWNGDGHYTEQEGPPRKKVNRGPSQDAFVTPDSPPSPDVQRAGHRRRVPSIGMDIISMSSDDSLPEPGRLLPSSSKSRLTKSRPSSSPAPNPMSEAPQDDRFIRFKMTMPMESTVRVQAAWNQAGGDVKKATAILSDISWSPRPANTRVEKEALGRVKEIDEATRAQRAAAKEKGKRSMIYANRPVLEAKIPSTPPPSKSIIDLAGPSPAAPVSPITPALKAPQRKRAKKLVIDSDSEPELGESSDDGRDTKRLRLENTYESRALEYLNSSGPEALQELTGCTPEQAKALIELRPFTSPEDIRSKLGQGKKKAGPSGISPRMFEDCTSILEGYGSVDNVLEDCEQIGAELRATMSSWNINENSKPVDNEDGALSLLSLGALKNHKTKKFITSQPKLLPDNVSLKEYQLIGVNWLNLLYRSHLSCILADEMGLGKTIQVISFLAYLKEQGNKGPHLIVVPSSTLENWCREFARFAPSIVIQTYYADKNERPQLRQLLTDTQRCQSKTGEGWEVLITTYNLAQGDDRDRKFFRRIEWDCCVYDEGHVLKNFQSQRYQSLLKFGSNWRLLLTGTPLQNNLQELVSLLNFILPDRFAGSLTSLRAIFKVKGDTKVTLLSQERISRAKKMMTPFVLRRRKDQVLKDLPKKTERIEWCDMTKLQQSIYRDALQRSRKTIIESEVSAAAEPASAKPVKKSKTSSRPKDKVYLENSSNVLMDLRKAASHPMLFRTRFSDEALTGITKQLLKEPDFRKRGALFDHVKEDMTVMTDAELQLFCATYKSTRKYLQDQGCYIDAGKVQVLLKLLSGYAKEQRKVLIFSQFTQILDILQAILKNMDTKYLILTGNTPVDIRQTLVDEFTEDESIPIFLLSTKAGGMGINLTAASVVIMFDQDFNPHNDRQAQDRAYRIGQKRDVEVIKLISRGTIEEDMLRLGETKLALDEAVAGDGEEKEESAPERTMKTSLMNVLRKQFEKEQGGAVAPSSSENSTESS